MEKTSNLEQHESLLRQIHDTYSKKNHDYGDSFSRSYKKYGIVAALVRMEDKWNRLDNLANGEKPMVADETIRDTLMDLANYSIMTVMELDKEKSLKNQRNFEEQVREQYADRNLDPIGTPDDVVSVERTEKVILHDEENGDTETKVPAGPSKKPIDEGKVMALYKAKWSQTKIADEMGCSQGRISQIIRAHKSTV